MLYSKNHSFLLPKSCGKYFGDLSLQEMRNLKSELTDAEKGYAHAKYYYSMPAPLSEIHKAAIQAGPIDPAKAFDIQDYGKFMNNTGHCEVENGYCVLPNGVTYAAVLLNQEGRTDEMVNFYNQHFAKEDSLFYKTWYPGEHFMHYENGALESFGFGRMNMRFAGQVQVEQLGMKFEDIEKNDPNCIMVGGTTAVGYNIDAQDPDKAEWNTIVFYYRQTPTGREVRVRLRYGVGIDNGQYVYTPPKKECAEYVAKCTMIHVMQEYTNDDYLERMFWEEHYK